MLGVGGRAGRKVVGLGKGRDEGKAEEGREKILLGSVSETYRHSPFNFHLRQLRSAQG